MAVCAPGSDAPDWEFSSMLKVLELSSDTGLRQGAAAKADMAASTPAQWFNFDRKRSVLWRPYSFVLPQAPHTPSSYTSEVLSKHSKQRGLP